MSGNVSVNLLRRAKQIYRSRENDKVLLPQKLKNKLLGVAFLGSVQ